MADIEQLCAVRGRRHRGRDLRPRDLHRRPRLRRGAGARRRAAASVERPSAGRCDTPAMLAKRIIPCLDVTGGRVVKGVNFVELRDAGDPVEIAARYNEQGADELTFLDITATSDGRDLILHIIEAVASQVFIPLTVGGGVRTVRRRAPAAQRRRRQGQLQLGGGGQPAGDPRRVGEVRRAVHRRRDRRQAPRAERRAARLGRLHPRRPHATPASTRCEWATAHGARAAPARSCSPAWTATAPRPASTSSSRARSATRCRCR